MSKILSIEIPAGESGKSKRTIMINQTGETNLDEGTFDYLVDHPEHDKDLPAGLLGTINRKRNKGKQVEKSAAAAAKIAAKEEDKADHKHAKKV